MSRIVVVTLLLAACGSNDNNATLDQKAAATFFDVYGVVQTVQQRALAAQPAVAPVAQTIDFVGPCMTSGTASMHGTYDGDGSTHATYAFDVIASACAESGSTIDGAMQWTGSVGGTDTNPVFSETMDGTVLYDGPVYAGTFGFHHVTITTTVTNMSATVTVSGSYTIGGVTYTIDPAAWAALFGG